MAQPQNGTTVIDIKPAQEELYPVKVRFKGEAYKKGEKTNTWHKRYVIITKNFIAYMHTEKDTEAKFIPIGGDGVIVNFIAPPHQFKRNLVMEVKSGAEVHYFSSDSNSQFMQIFSLVSHPEISVEHTNKIETIPVAVLQRIADYSLGLPAWGTRFNYRPYLPNNQPNGTPYRRPDDDIMLTKSPYVTTDWNVAWQTAWDVFLTHPDSEFYRNKLYRIVGEFYKFCKPVVMQIIREMCLPTSQRTVKPTGNPSIFIIGGNVMMNICQSPSHAKNSKYAMSLECALDDEIAMRIGKNDIRGLGMYLKARVEGIHVPLAVLIEYKAFRIFCMALFTTTPENTIVQGVANNRFLFDNEASNLLSSAGSRVNLQKHLVPMEFDGYIEQPPQSIDGLAGNDNGITNIITTNDPIQSCVPTLNTNVEQPQHVSDKRPLLSIDEHKCYSISHSSELQVHRVPGGNKYTNDGEFKEGKAKKVVQDTLSDMSQGTGNASDQSIPIAQRFLASKDRIYITNCSRVIPADMPRPYTLEYLLKQFRPEFMERIDTPLSSDAYSSLCGNKGVTSDAKSNDNLAAAASFTLRRVVIPAFVKDLELMSPPITTGEEFVDMMHSYGISLNLVSLVYAKLSLPYLKVIIHNELAARACRKVLYRMIRRMTRYFRWNGIDVKTVISPNGMYQTIDPNVTVAPADKAVMLQSELNNCIIEFFNKAFSGNDPNEGSNELWNDLIYPHVEKTYGIDIKKSNNTKLNRTVNVSIGTTPTVNTSIAISIPLVFSRLQSLTGIIFNDVMAYNIIGNTEANMRSGISGTAPVIQPMSYANPGMQQMGGMNMLDDQTQSGPFTQAMMREIIPKYWHFLPEPFVKYLYPGNQEKVEIQKGFKVEKSNDPSAPKPDDSYKAAYLRSPTMTLDLSNPEKVTTSIERTIMLYGYNNENLVNGLNALSTIYRVAVVNENTESEEEIEEEKSEEVDLTDIDINRLMAQASEMKTPDATSAAASPDAFSMTPDPAKPWEALASQNYNVSPTSPGLTREPQLPQNKKQPPEIPKHHRWVFELPIDLIKDIIDKRYLKMYGIINPIKVENRLVSEIQVQQFMPNGTLIPPKKQAVMKEKYLKKLRPMFLNKLILKDKKWRNIAEALDTNINTSKIDEVVTPETKGPKKEENVIESLQHVYHDYAYYIGLAALGLVRRISPVGVHTYETLMKTAWDTTISSIDETLLAYGEAERILRFLYSFTGKISGFNVPLDLPLLNNNMGKVYLDHKYYPNAFDILNTSIQPLDNILGSVHPLLAELYMECGHSVKGADEEKLVNMPEHKTAYSYYSRALSIYQATHGQDSVAASFPMFYMAECGYQAMPVLQTTETIYESTTDFYINRRVGTTPSPNAAPLALCERALNIRMKRLGPYSFITLNSIWQHGELLYEAHRPNWVQEMETVIHRVREMIGTAVKCTPEVLMGASQEEKPQITQPSINILLKLLTRLLKLLFRSAPPVFATLLDKIREQYQPFSNKDCLDQVATEVLQANSIHEYVNGLMTRSIARDAAAYEKLGCLYQLVGGGYLKMWKPAEQEPDYYTGPEIPQQMGMMGMSPSMGMQSMPPYSPGFQGVQPMSAGPSIASRLGLGGR